MSVLLKLPNASHILDTARNFPTNGGLDLKRRSTLVSSRTHGQALITCSAANLNRAGFLCAIAGYFDGPGRVPDRWSRFRFSSVLQRSDRFGMGRGPAFSLLQLHMRGRKYPRV